MRWWRVVALAAGVGLLLSSVLLVVRAGRAQAERDQQQVLRSAADQRADALEAHFERARALVLTISRSPSFRDFYAAPGPRAAKVAAGGPELTEATRLLQYLESLYPDSLGEACFIDRGGAENARVTRGVAAPVADLSPDERVNPFFGPAFARPPDRAYQAAPYLSPDMREWVIASAAQVPAAGSGPTPAIVHFEVTLESFRRALGATPGVRVRIVDAATGAVVIDGDRPLRPVPDGADLPQDGAGPGGTDAAAFAGQVGSWGAAGVLEQGGERLAYRRLAADEDNANRWIVVAGAPAARGSWRAATGAGPIGLVAAALLLLAYGVLDSRLYERRLRRMAHLDALTGLPNRSLFADRLDHALARAGRDGHEVSVILLDLDRFKEINDTLGHEYGDELLRAVTDRLATGVREADTFARLGGDEFALVLDPDGGIEGALGAVRRIQDALAGTFLVKGIPVRVGCSIGIARYPQHGTAAADLLRHADVAMYDAKRNGGGHRFYDAGRNTLDERRIALATALPDAVRNGELLLHYQPKIDVADGRVTAVEALVRWDHPDLGLVPPVEFLHLAEELGVIGPLTVEILDQALAQCRRWHEDGHRITVAVNLSALSLSDADLVDEVTSALDRHGLPGGALELELTETSLMRDPAGAVVVLKRLSELGIRLSIDDFGTGYSSLAYLKQLPVHELKIDRSFVTTMRTDAADEFIVGATVDLGHRLGLTVVAEGVEDADVLRRLADLGCDQAQGYHIARPAPAAVITEWLAGHLPGTRPSGAGTPVPAARRGD